MEANKQRQEHEVQVIVDALTRISDKEALCVITTTINRLADTIRALETRITSLEGAVTANQRILMQYKSVADKATSTIISHATTDAQYLRTLTIMQKVHQAEMDHLDLLHRNNIAKILSRSRSCKAKEPTTFANSCYFSPI